MWQTTVWMSVAVSNITCLVNFLKNVITLFFSKQSFRNMTTDFSEICAVLLVKIVAHIFQLVSLTFLVFFVYYIKILFSFFSHFCDTQFVPMDYLKHTSVIFFLNFWGIWMEFRTHSQLSQTSLNPQHSCFYCFRSMFIYIFIIFLKQWNFWRNRLRVHSAIFLQQIATIIPKAAAWWKVAFKF